MSLRDLSRQLRREATDAESRLWFHLRGRLLAETKFRRQRAIGRYIVDFVSLERRLIVELDGSQHLDQIKQDDERTAFLVSKGFTVLRFWNNEVLKDTDAVLGAIRHHLLR